MNVLLYNSYNLFFPQYLNTERSTYQLFCNTALRALLHQLKAYYGQKCLCFVLFLVGNNQNGNGIFFFCLVFSDETKCWEHTEPSLNSEFIFTFARVNRAFNTSKTKHHPWQWNACPPQAATSPVRALAPSFGRSWVGREELQTIGKADWIQCNNSKKGLDWTSSPHFRAGGWILSC